MTDFYLKSGAGAIVLANRAWSNGEKMVPTLGDATTNVALARRWVWEVTTAGTSNGTPAWAAAVTQDVTTVTQNGVVWTARMPGYSSGTTANWAFAAIYMHYVASALAAGDRLFVSNNHAETQATVQSNSVFPGTLTSPNQILCVNDGATPPTAVATTATVTTTGAFGITLAGTFYMYGITFSGATGGTGANSGMANASAVVREVFEKCAFKIGSTVANTWTISVSGQLFPAEVIWLDCDIRLNATSQRFRFNNVKFDWRGGTYLSGGTNPTSLFTASSGGVGATADIQGVDFSNLATTFSFVVVQPGSVVDFRVARCKMPASWTGGIWSSTLTVPGCRGTIHGFGNGANLYPIWEEDFAGVIREETILVKTGGSSDGTTPISWKLSANASNIQYPRFGLAGPKRSIWNDTTGGAKNVAIEIIHNSAALLTNADVYLAVDALTNSGSVQAARSSDGPADVMTAAANQSTSTAAWDSLVQARQNTAGYTAPATLSADWIKVATNPGRVFFCTTTGTTAGSEPGGYASAVDGDSVTDGTAVFRAGYRQKIDVTVTPQVKGPILYTPVLTKASQVVWVDPRATIS